jgi:hypothetical protein
LAVTTHSQIPKNVVLKEKERHENKSLANWKQEEKFQCSFEEAIKNLQLKEAPRDFPRANMQTLVKSNLIGNSGSIPKTKLPQF